MTKKVNKWYLFYSHAMKGVTENGPLSKGYINQNYN